MLQSYIHHKFYKSLAQNHEQTRYLSLSDSQHTLSSIELLQTKLSSLKKEIADIESQNALLNKRRGIKHAVAFLLGKTN